MKEVNKEHQKQFFDFTFEFEARKSVSKFYAVVKSSTEYYEKFLLSNCHSKKVLEYGCGTGSYAFLLTKCGANVVGIDISEVAIKLSKERAKKEGLKDILFLAMDAEAMQFEDSSFDIICGTGILHHLNIDRALRELARVLKPEGKAIFIEPMGYNPLINLFRKFTPHLRTRDEHPLTVKDLSFMEKFFHKVQCEFFHLFSLLAVPFRNSRIFPSLLKVLDNFDNNLFRWIPLVRLFAWAVVIILEKPKKADLRK
jgi:ubiquinone/menaquinone biosynthesis C-methylase UbiE